MSTKEREERLKTGKERLKTELKQKEEKKRKQLEINATEELCLLQRKHISMLHKREYELLSNVLKGVFKKISKIHITLIFMFKTRRK